MPKQRTSEAPCDLPVQLATKLRCNLSIVTIDMGDPSTWVQPEVSKADALSKQEIPIGSRPALCQSRILNSVASEEYSVSYTHRASLPQDRSWYTHEDGFVRLVSVQRFWRPIIIELSSHTVGLQPDNSH